MGGIADGSGNFAEGNFPGSLAKAVDVALIFGEPVGDFEAEGDGLGVNAVGAADLRGVLEFVGAQVEDLAEEDEVAFDDAGSVAEEECLRGVDDVIGGHAIVEPTRGGRIADGFTDGHSEGDDVVFDLGFDFVDASDVDSGAGTQNGGGFARDLAGFGEGVGGGELDIEPFLVAVGVAPDAAHLLTGITWNHGYTPCCYRSLSHVAANAAELGTVPKDKRLS